MTAPSDSNERLRASEQALRASRHLIQRITDAAPATIYIYDLVRRQNVYSNRNMVATLGYSPEEIVAMGSSVFAQLMHPDDLAKLPKQLARFMTASDSDILEIQYRMRHANGRWCWLFSREVIFARDEAQQPIQILGVVQDVTTQVEALEEVQRLNSSLESHVQERTSQLEAAVQELEAFSYSVSHDLRAPLRAIDGFSRIVWQEYGEHLDGDGRDYLHLICENTRQMGQLIDDLLAFSRLSRQALQCQALAMNDLVSHALQDFSNELAERQVQFSIEELGPCHGDPALLRIVWVNLIANALKYSRQQPQTEITIGIREIESEKIYFISDNGVGFAMQYAHKLFGVFQRLHRVEEYEGTGVGLATVQRIIHRHGGRVWGEAAPNQGATFSFTLPTNP